MDDIAKKLGIDMSAHKRREIGPRQQKTIAKAQALHDDTYRLVGRLIDLAPTQDLDLTETTHAFMGAAEAALLAVAACLTADFANKAEKAKMEDGTYMVRSNDVLFAALLTWVCTQDVRDPHGENPMVVAREAYRKLTGKDHISILALDCDCQECSDIRQRNNLKKREF